ncbi:MAG: hypothetical protein LBE92_21815 [Chryseobacterium sp.]|uniref:hypothetical protein n=1 Tax=Chryseobacterium sp. TaxID=1871047 RepID=UPI00282A5021|nr:hypothetical protein [Chryseobacterium sp.]MDR2238760.1 hypothetical protein [Chryseobacterium sp.]
MKRVLFLLLFLTISMFNAQIHMNIGSTNTGTAPVSTFFSYSYVQQIYPKQELNASASGNITGLTFYLDPSSKITDSSNWTVYLGHTSKTAFTSATDWVPLAQLTQVFEGTVINNNGKVQIVFASPFAFNNTDNLVVAAKENSASIDINNFDEVFHVYPHLQYSTLYYKGDKMVIDPVSPPGGIRADYKSAVTFSGLTPRTTPGCPFVTNPLNNAFVSPVFSNISWLPVEGAGSYKVSLGTSPGGTDLINQQPVTANTMSPALTLVRNTDYYLKVVAVSGAGESTGCQDIFFRVPPTPVNDDCANALVASVFPYTYVQNDGVTATNNAGNIAVCSDAMNDGTWFKFTGDGSEFTVVITLPSGSTFDPQMGIYMGSCGNLTCRGTVDSNGAGGQEGARFVTVAGTDYYINIGSFEETVDVPEGNFTISITKT